MNNNTTTLKALSLLFLDNSRTTRAAMSMILGDKGYEVVTVATGPEAIEKLKTTPFDVLVTDLYMPLMNGHEVARMIRELPDHCKDIPIIVLTASVDPKDQELCKNAGINEFIVKSDDHTALLSALDSYSHTLRKS